MILGAPLLGTELVAAIEFDRLVSLLVALSTNVAILLLASLGLAIVYGVRGVINLAHGEFIMLGAYASVLCNQRGVPFGFTIPIAFIGVAVIGLVVERLLIRHLYERLADTMLATWGLGLIATQLVILTFGTTIGGISIPFGHFSVGSYTIAVYNLVIIVVTLMVLAVTSYLFTKTDIGLLVRATAASRSVSAGLGVNVGRVDSATFAFGAGLAGLAGAVLAPFLGVAPTMGQTMIGEVFLTVLVGGTGSAVRGVVTAAASLGAVDNLASTWWAPIAGQVGLLMAAIAIVRVRAAANDMGDR